MSLALSRWTGNSHEVSGRFSDYHLDLFMGGFAKDTCEDGMRHLCLNAFGRNGVGSLCLGGTGSRSTKGRCLVGSNEDTDDANEKSTGCSVPVFGVCGNIGNGHTADNDNGILNCRFSVSLKLISIRGCVEKGCSLVLLKKRSALVMSAKLLSSHEAQDIT